MADSLVHHGPTSRASWVGCAGAVMVCLVVVRLFAEAEILGLRLQTPRPVLVLGTVLLSAAALSWGASKGVRRHLGAISVSCRESSLWSTIKAVLACCLFMLVGPILVMINKHILDGLSFNYPVLLSSLGQISSAILSHCLVRLQIVAISPASLQLMQSCATFRIALPIGIMKTVSIAASNAVYLHLGVGFIQMMKAFSPAIVVLVMVVFRMPPPSPVAVASVAVIVAGTLLEVQGEMRASTTGIGILLSGETAEAIALVLTQKLFKSHNFTILESLYLIAPANSFFLLLIFAVLELPRMIAKGDHVIMLDNMLPFVMNSILGTLVSFLGLLVVQTTSGLTLRVLNTARCIALVIVSVTFYGELITMLELIGYAVALSGFSAYTWSQMYPESCHQLEIRLRCRDHPQGVHDVKA